MNKKIIQEISKNLPLTIESIEWNDPILSIIGKGWNFSTVSSWRIISNNKLESGCYDSEVLDLLRYIKEFKIISVDFQARDRLFLQQPNPIFETRSV